MRVINVRDIAFLFVALLSKFWSICRYFKQRVAIAYDNFHCVSCFSALT